MTEKKDEALTYAQIKDRLKEPIAAELLSQKTVSGAKIKFVNVTDVKDLLDKRCGGSHWEVPETTTIIDPVSKRLYMTVKLVINASDGVFCQVGHGSETLDNSKIYGKPDTNAYAQALRRAAESHGLARELWREEISAEQWELPCNEKHIATLVNFMEILGKLETTCAMYYSDQRTDLFGELTIKEAMRAINELSPKVEAKQKEKQKNTGAKK